jgi:hypothetical protein
MSRNFIVILASIAALSLSVVAPTIALAAGGSAQGAPHFPGLGGSHGGGSVGSRVTFPNTLGQGSSCCYTPPRGNKPVPK